MKFSTLNNDYKTVLRNVALNVRRLRKAQNKSQDTLAHEADIDRTYIGYIENQKHNVSLGKLCAVAKVLHVDVEELLKMPPKEEE